MKTGHVISARRTLAVVLAALTLMMWVTPAGAAPSAVGAAFDQAPANAQVVIVVPNLKKLSDDLAQWQQATGVPAPRLKNLLATLKQQMHISAGLNDAGSLMLVIPDIQTAFADPQAPGMLILVPVADYNAFVKSLASSGSPQAGVTALKLPGGKPAYARQVGGYAVISPNEQVVKQYAAGHQGAAMIRQAGAVGAKAIGSCDIGLYVDVQAISPAAIPMIDQGLAQMEANIAGGRSGMGRQAAEDAAALKLYGQAVKAVLRQSKALVSTIDIKSQGVAMSDVLQAKPNTEITRLFPGGAGNLTGKLLNELPNASYLFAASYDLKAIDLSRLVDLVVSSMPANSPVLPMLKLMQQQSGAMLGVVNGSAGVILAPSQQGMMSGGLIRGINLYDTSDSKTFLAKNNAYVKSLDGKSFDITPPNNNKPAEKIGFSTSYTAHADTVEGQSVDQYQIKMNLPANMPQNISPLLMLMGGTGYTGYITALGNDVIQTTSADKDLLKQGLAAMKQKRGLGSKADIKSLRKQLPAHLAMESYLSLSGIAKTANLFLPLLRVPPIPVPKNVSPIASGMGIDQNAIQYTLFVPNESTSFVVSTAQRLFPVLSGLGGHRQNNSPSGPSAPY